VVSATPSKRFQPFRHSESQHPNAQRHPRKLGIQRFQTFKRRSGPARDHDRILIPCDFQSSSLELGALFMGFDIKKVGRALPALLRANECHREAIPEHIRLRCRGCSEIASTRIDGPN
jgi:hypothetical protein